MAREAGLDGVVASPPTIRLIRASVGSDFIIVTPASVAARRPRATLTTRQRTLAARHAIDLGPAFLVVGGR